MVRATVRVSIDLTNPVLPVTIAASSATSSGRRKAIGTNTWEELAEMPGDLISSVDTWFPENVAAP
jgi:hypothetical protein